MKRLKKASGLTQHVIPMGRGWAVKKESASDFFLITETQREAVKVARELARNTSTILVIHDRNGAIRSSESYVIPQVERKKSK